MLTKGKILSSLLVCSALTLSGCSLFQGQYQAPISYRADDSENSVSFEDGADQLDEKLDDLANGRATSGTPSQPAATAAATQASSQVNKEKSMPVVIDIKKNYSAVMRTDAGDIKIALTAAKTPVTVNNFVLLSKSNFYNNTVFHRVIKGFMIQGGDPKGDGTGNPGYTFADEPFDGEYTRGTLAMANSGPNTNGCQFFIMHNDYPLEKNYVIFGHVTAGLDVLDKIASAPVVANASGEKSQPVNPVKILSVEIFEN